MAWRRDGRWPGGGTDDGLEEGRGRRGPACPAAAAGARSRQLAAGGKGGVGARAQAQAAVVFVRGSRSPGGERRPLCQARCAAIESFGSVRQLAARSGWAGAAGGVVRAWVSGCASGATGLGRGGGRRQGPPRGARVASGGGAETCPLRDFHGSFHRGGGFYCSRRSFVCLLVCLLYSLLW